jgi:hypothetical protein
MNENYCSIAINDDDICGIEGNKYINKLNKTWHFPNA